MATRIGKRKIPDFDAKYLAIGDDHVAVRATYSSTDFDKSAPSGITVGPVTMVHNVGTNEGWLNHPDEGHVLVTRDKVTVVVPGIEDASSRVDEYSTAEYDAFIILVPKTEKGD